MSNPTDLVKLLSQMPVFGGLSDSALIFILENSPSILTVSGDFFFHEGDAASSFFVLTEGTVVIEKNWKGVPVEIRRLGVGDCLGEMAIIDLQPRSASVRADRDCQAIEITRSTLHQLFKQDLEQYAGIMMNMGREVSRRLRMASERLFEMDQTMSI